MSTADEDVDSRLTGDDWIELEQLESDFDVGKEVQEFLDAVAGRELLKQLQKEHPSVVFEYRLQNRIRRRTNGRYFNKIRVDASVGAFDTLLIVAVVFDHCELADGYANHLKRQTLYVDPPETVDFPRPPSHCESIRGV